MRKTTTPSKRRASGGKTSGTASLGAYTVAPRGDRLMIRLVEPDETTPAGLHIPQSAQTFSRLMGVVVAVGPDVPGDGSFQGINVGDRVLLSSMAQYDYFDPASRVAIVKWEHIAAHLS